MAYLARFLVCDQSINQVFRGNGLGANTTFVPDAGVFYEIFVTMFQQNFPGPSAQQWAHGRPVLGEEALEESGHRHQIETGEFQLFGINGQEPVSSR